MSRVRPRGGAGNRAGGGGFLRPIRGWCVSTQRRPRVALRPPMAGGAPPVATTPHPSRGEEGSFPWASACAALPSSTTLLDPGALFSPEPQAPALDAAEPCQGSARAEPPETARAEEASSAPSGAGVFSRHDVHGLRSARLWRAALHPWLQPFTPRGVKRGASPGLQPARRSRRPPRYSTPGALFSPEPQASACAVFAGSAPSVRSSPGGRALVARGFSPWYAGPSSLMLFFRPSGPTAGAYHVRPTGRGRKVGGSLQPGTEVPGNVRSHSVRSPRGSARDGLANVRDRLCFRLSWLTQHGGDGTSTAQYPSSPRCRTTARITGSSRSSTRAWPILVSLPAPPCLGAAPGTGEEPAGQWDHPFCPGTNAPRTGSAGEQPAVAKGA
jgi:hypothetical protein